MAAATLAPAVNTIRPLGEEQLRMFKRTVGTLETASKINPKKFLRRPKLKLSHFLTESWQAEETAKEEGGRLATLKEVIFAIEDERQYEAIKHHVFWTSDELIKLHGPCRINYREKRLEEVSEEEWDKLPGRLRVYVFRRNNRPAFHIGTNSESLIVFAYNNDDVALSVFVKKEK